jgi:flagellin-like hook-associated protein FlgL
MKLDSLIFNVTQMQLARTSRSISRGLERIATGNRLLHPEEDIASFSLFARLQTSIREKTQRINNLNQETALLNVAQTGIQSQIEITQRLREIFVEAESGALSNEQRQNLQAEVKSLLEEFNRVASDTSFNGQPLLTGEKTLGEFQLPNLSSAETFKQANGNFSFTSSNVNATLGGTDNILQDVNGDGIDDLLTINGTNFSVLIADGEGHYSIRSQYATPAADITSADFNNDGLVDVAYSNATEGSVSIQLSNGDGTFQTRTSFASSGAVSLEVGDFDEDGILDIITRTGPSGISSVQVFKGDGLGSYSAIATIAAGFTLASSPNLITIGDLNADGHLDFVTNDYIDSKVSVVLGNGDGTFQARVSYSTMGGGNVQDLGDLDNDGDLDIVVGGSGFLRFLTNNGSGVFGAATLLASPATSVQAVKVADLDNDGFNEVFANGFVYKNNRDLTFTLAATLSFSTRSAIGDINNDGVVDVINAFNKYVANPVYRSGLSELSVVSGDAEASLRIIDGALSTLEDSLSQLTAEQQRRLHQIDSEFLTRESLEEAKANVSEPNFSMEVANILAEQIKQQAQLAVLAQANTQRQIVLSLLSNL